MIKTESKKIGTKALLLALLISVAALFCSCYGEREPMPPKETLIAAVEAATDEAGYAYAATYLDRWGFSYFYPQRLREVEAKFKSYYVDDMPTHFELAKSAAIFFLEKYYDAVDLTDINAVTVAIIDSYVRSIGDKYAIYRLPEQYDSYQDDMSGEYCGIGVSIEYSYAEGTLRVTAVAKDSPAEAAGFLPDDYIVAVGDKRVSELGFDGTAAAIKGPVGTTVDVTVLRGEDEITLTATRQKLVDKTVYYELSNDGIGYVQITTFKANTPTLFKEALDYMEENEALGIIFDLRSNPGGYLSAVLEMLEYIVPEDVMLTSYTYRNGTTVELKSEKPDRLNIPCAVLCNGQTASAAELFTSAIRDFGEMGLIEEFTVGQRTYGKGIMQYPFPLSNGATITMTIAYYYTPLGENYHDEGITPDEIVENSGDNDTQFDTALIMMWNLVSK